jgi:ATP-dependent DNA ligase
MARKIGEKFFYPERPRLLHKDQDLFRALSDDRDWVAEPKWNGKHLVLHRLPSGEFQFWNRHGERMSYAPSAELLADLAGLNLKGHWQFDGELRDGKVKGVRHKVVLWDVFVADGVILTGVPFCDRRGILETLWHYCGPDTGERLDLAPQFDGDFPGRFESYRDDDEIEGLVLKNKRGQLSLGRTGPQKSAWMWKVRKPSGIVRF